MRYQGGFMSTERFTRACNVYDVITDVVTRGFDSGQIQCFVKFPGCNLKCNGCEDIPTPEDIDSCRFEGTPGMRDFYYVSTPVFHVDLAKVLANHSGHTSLVSAIRLCGGEPLLYPEFICNLSKDLPPECAEVRLVTNGSLPDALGEAIDAIDTLVINYKMRIVDGVEPYIEDLRKCVSIARDAEKRVEVNIRVSGEVLESEVREIAVAIAETDSDIPLCIIPTLSGKTGSKLTADHLKLMRLAYAANYKLNRVQLKPSFNHYFKDSSPPLNSQNR
jgi:pyruvate-formate lyase-activating enzyme